jgi:phage-related minor tail protein
MCHRHMADMAQTLTASTWTELMKPVGDALPLAQAAVKVLKKIAPGLPPIAGTIGGTPAPAIRDKNDAFVGV